MIQPSIRLPHLPRGLRNNNPLNIRISSVAWMGKVNPSEDSAFEQFVSIWWGIRAAMVNLRTHLQQDRRLLRKTTVAQEIARWAPQSENDTAAYVQFVCSKAQMQSAEILEFKNKNQICRFFYAAALFENGIEVPFNYFETGYEMVLNPSFARHIGRIDGAV